MNVAIVNDIAAALGDDSPLIGDGRRRPPDRREISARWLAGTALTGLTSFVLMGVALYVALDGRQQLATPPEIAKLQPAASSGKAGEAAKLDRIAPPPKLTRATDRRRMEVSTLSKVGNANVVRMMPFMSVKMALAAGYTTARKYPEFNPVSVSEPDPSDADDGAEAQSSLIIGYKVDSDVTLETVEFPSDRTTYVESGRLSGAEVEAVVREAAADLGEGAVQVASLHYVDPQRFGEEIGPGGFSGALTARILQQNISVSGRSAAADRPSFAEDVIPVRMKRAIDDILADAGYRDETMSDMATALGKILNTRSLDAGATLRVGIETGEEADRIVRASVYDGSQHLVTVALDDRGQYVAAEEPEQSPAIAAAFDEKPAPLRVRGELPTVYDGIFRAAYSYGFTKAMTQQVVKMVAADVDFQSRISPSDRIEAFFSLPDDTGAATPESELLYVKATFGGATRSFYRFRMKDGATGFFDENGKSSRQFLLRSAVPKGVFRSGFGMRRHPILGYSKMHTGVDWAAPVGTPIVATGSGVVQKAGWAGGYGKQTIIRHSNGYETSYNHQSRIAQGVVPGARIRQGQIIGYVGTTGLSTGPHLHYELIVNGVKVDPMRVRLPTGRVLKGDELEVFKRERDRIDELLRRQNDKPQKVAAAG